MVHHKQPCPCGSGKRYKHCHMEQDLKRRQNGLWIALAAVAVAGAAILITVNLRGRGAAVRGAAVPGTPVSRTATATTASAMPVVPQQTADRARQADAASALAAARAMAASGQKPRIMVRRQPNPVNALRARINESTPVAVDQTPLPDGRMPSPYYYDGAKNRYWSPEHYHWHPGRPPADALKKLRDAATVTGAKPAVPSAR